MNYLSELSEKLFIRKVVWMKKQQTAEPISRRLDKPVLYEEDAYEVLRYWVNRTGPEKLYPGPYKRESNLLRLVCDSRNLFYWVYYNDGLYYAVQIGARSQLYVGRTSYIPYCDLARKYNDVEVEIASNILPADEETSLWAKFVYDENGLSPFVLVIKGIDVPSINKAPWNSEVDLFDPEALQKKQYDVMGRRGEWYEAWYNELYDEVYRCQKRPEEGGSWIHANWWKGEKIICQYFSVERPTVQEMYETWNNLR